MAQAHLKSVHPVNLLSFGPKTEPIELRDLNILIGPNGSGKSNFIEIIRLLHFLPDKDPWEVALNTGGVSEWIWKGANGRDSGCSLRAKLSLGEVDGKWAGVKPEYLGLSVDLEKYGSSFRVKREAIGTCGDGNNFDPLLSSFESSGSQGTIHLRMARAEEGPITFNLNMDRSILSQLSSPTVASEIGGNLPELFEMAEFFESFDFHQDWEFGVDSPPRDPRPVGQSVARLEENAYNLAQMLAHYRDRHKPIFEQLTDLVKRFYEPTKNVEIIVVGTHLQIAIEEKGGFSTPATRLSDGMLRWLSILCILLNPTPAPLTCIDEPELGLHPDVIPTLADLLREASTRTQLIVTTHSSALVDAFTDDPESICVCEKIEGSTVVRRLDRTDLEIWLKDYSLGNLWTSGEIGGNRW
jgi:predicted ATPase